MFNGLIDKTSSIKIEPKSKKKYLSIMFLKTEKTPFFGKVVWGKIELLIFEKAFLIYKNNFSEIASSVTTFSITKLVNKLLLLNKF